MEQCDSWDIFCQIVTIERLPRVIPLSGRMWNGGELRYLSPSRPTFINTCFDVDQVTFLEKDVRFPNDPLQSFNSVNKSTRVHTWLRERAITLFMSNVTFLAPSQLLSLTHNYLFQLKIEKKLYMSRPLHAPPSADENPDHKQRSFVRQQFAGDSLLQSNGSTIIQFNTLSSRRGFVHIQQRYSPYTVRFLYTYAKITAIYTNENGILARFAAFQVHELQFAFL